MINANPISRPISIKSPLQPRSEASLAPMASYGAINEPPLSGSRSQSSTTVSTLFPLTAVQNSKESKTTSFIEIPKCWPINSVSFPKSMLPGLIFICLRL